MASLQAIFQRAALDTSAHYTVNGVTYAIVLKLPAILGYDGQDGQDGQAGRSLTAPLARFRLLLLHGSLAGSYEGTQLELVTLLASADPPIPSQRGWTLQAAPSATPEASRSSSEGEC